MEADLEADAGTDKRRNGSGGSRYRKMSVYPAHLSEVKPEKTLNFKEKAPDCIRKVTYMGRNEKTAASEMLRDGSSVCRQRVQIEVMTDSVC